MVWTSWTNHPLPSSPTGRSGGESGQNLQHIRLSNAHEWWTCGQQLHPAGSTGRTSNCAYFKRPTDHMLPMCWSDAWDKPLNTLASLSSAAVLDAVIAVDICESILKNLDTLVWLNMQLQESLILIILIWWESDSWLFSCTTPPLFLQNSCQSLTVPLTWRKKLPKVIISIYNAYIYMLSRVYRLIDFESWNWKLIRHLVVSGEKDN